LSDRPRHDSSQPSPTGDNSTAPDRSSLPDSPLGDSGDVSREERSALTASPSPGEGPWWAEFPPRPAGLGRVVSERIMLAASIVSALVLAGVTLVGYYLPIDRAVLSVLTLAPTVLVLLWALLLRRQLAAVAHTLLLVVIIALPIYLVLMAYRPPGDSPLWLIVSSAVVVLLLAASALWLLRTSMGVLVAVGYTALAIQNLLLNGPDIVPQAASYRWIFLAIYGFSASAAIVPLVRRSEASEQEHFGARMGLLAVTWSLTVCCVHLLVRLARVSGDQFHSLTMGPWLMTLGGLLLVCGVAFARSPSPQRKSPSRAFGIVLASLAGLAALTALLISIRQTAPMLINLGILAAVTVPLGIFHRGHGRTAIQALAAVSVPLAGAYVAMALAYPESQSLDVGWLYLAIPESAPVGLALGAIVVYLVGLFTLDRTRRWTHSVASVAGLALGALAFLGMVTAGGQAQLSDAASQSVLYIPALGIMIAMIILTLVSAWWIAWQPAVYLAALGLLITVSQYAPPGDSAAAWQVGAAVWVAVTGAAMSLLGGGLTWLGRRWPLARFYSEGLLVMGLAATTLTALAAPAAANTWQSLVSADVVLLLAALAASLLVSAIRFRQEDLFGFFCFALLVAVLIAADLQLEDREGGYLVRYQTVGLLGAIALAVASWPLAAWLRGREGFNRFGAAAYVVAFATAMVVLGLMPLVGNLAWRGGDLVGVAVILLFLRPHVRHPATGYAVAAAVIAAIFQFVASRYGDSAYRMHAASVIAAGALAVSLILVAHGLRHLLLAITHTSDKEARRRSRPFTVVGMTLAVALAGYLALQTALAYHDIWAGEPLLPALTETFDAQAGLLAWLGVLLAFLVSIWLFRHSARTIGFYLVGITATISFGPVLFQDGKHLTSYLICSVSGYGAIHMLVYLAERPYMALLSRVCVLYKDEHHASTAIFTVAAVSCFVGGLVAAFHIHTTAALVMMSLLTGVFFIWSFGQRRAEFIYPAVLFSLGALLSIWHNIEGPGPWTPDRLTINALVFAAGAPLWMAVGSWLHRRGGPMVLLAPAARQMSVLVALAGLGFLIALALSPVASSEPIWRYDSAADRMGYGLLCGAILTGYFLWAAASFRATLLVYLSELSLLALTVFVLTRVEGCWDSWAVAHYWPLWAAVASLATLGLGYVLERRRHVLYGRPILYTSVFVLPAATLGGTAVATVLGMPVPAPEAAMILAAAMLLGSLIRAAHVLLPAAAAVGGLGVAAWVLGDSFGWAGETWVRCAAAALLTLVAILRLVAGLRR